MVNSNLKRIKLLSSLLH